MENCPRDVPISSQHAHLTQHHVPQSGSDVSAVADAEAAGPDEPGEVGEWDVAKCHAAEPAGLFVRTVMSPTRPSLREVVEVLIDTYDVVRRTDEGTNIQVVAKIRVGKLVDRAANGAVTGCEYVAKRGRCGGALGKLSPVGVDS